MHFVVAAVTVLLATIAWRPANGTGLIACYQAQGAYKARGFDLAVQLLTECLDKAELTPESRASVLRARGSSFIQLQQYDRALADLDAAIRMQPEEAQGYLYRGELHRVQGQLEAALRDYDMGLRLRPDHALAKQARDATAAALAEGRPQAEGPPATTRPKVVDRPPEKAPAAAPIDRSVREAQTLLAQLGYYRGPANGQLDQSTRAAVTSFQRVKGLPPDGAITSDLLERLRGSL